MNIIPHFAKDKPTQLGAIPTEDLIEELARRDRDAKFKELPVRLINPSPKAFQDDCDKIFQDAVLKDDVRVNRTYYNLRIAGIAVRHFYGKEAENWWASKCY